MEMNDKIAKHWKRLLVEVHPEVKQVVDMFSEILLRGDHSGDRWVVSEDPTIVNVLEQYNTLFNTLAPRCVERGLVDGEVWIGLNLFGGVCDPIRILEGGWLSIEFDLKVPGEALGWLYEGSRFQLGDVIRMDFDQSLLGALLPGWESRSDLCERLQVPEIFFMAGVPSDVVLENEYPHVWSIVDRCRRVLCEGLRQICLRHFEQTGIEGVDGMFSLRIPTK